MVWAVAVGLVQRAVPIRRRFTGYGSFQLRSLLRSGGLKEIFLSVKMTAHQFTSHLKQNMASKREKKRERKGEGWARIKRVRSWI